ncbi:MAG: N-acyl homoserine lactonase family protein [Robiginitomaculum sp.]|nr:N-acyl homoserine lactonase family protein [Robiginitomaculum sp.]
MKHIILTSCLFFAACNNAPTSEKAVPDVETKTAPVTTSAQTSVKLYALECGRIDMLDLSLFDKGGAYAGRTNKAVSSCYLVRHPKGDLLWDTGLPDALNAMPDGVTNGPFHLAVPTTLESQLTALGVAATDIEYLSVSHSHFDHVGNAGAYASATFLVTEAEHTHLFRGAAREDKQTFSAYSALETAKTVKFTGEHDVFGDGTVTIVDTPGHTPGHTILKLELAKTGTVLLSGDLYHLHEAREKRTIPVFNTDADETLRSMDKFEALATKTNAKVIIQHSVQDFAELPKPPLYLD